MLKFQGTPNKFSCKMKINKTESQLTSSVFRAKISNQFLPIEFFFGNNADSVY